MKMTEIKDIPINRRMKYREVYEAMEKLEKGKTIKLSYTSPKDTQLAYNGIRKHLARMGKGFKVQGDFSHFIVYVTKLPSRMV